MKKIFLSTQIPDDKTAASKAKVDAMAILEKAGYDTVYFPKITSVSVFRKFWKELSGLVTKDTHLVLEYPCWPLKRIGFIYLFCLVKHIKVYGVIHDIGALRLGWSPRKDMLFLKMFDGLVSHNASMTAWLKEKGYKKKIVNLEVFDYCLSQPRNFHEPSIGAKFKVFYAGNLSYNKATYIYDKGLDRLDRVEFCVYGQHFEKERINGSKVNYKGVFNPDTPNLPENYNFGLVWEGSSLDTCDGAFGNYIRFNNPHKFSLYLSLGLPVIVWKEAAIAAFVEKNRIGFAISSFRDIEKIAERVTPEEYKEYIKNISPLSDKVRQGYFLTTAIEKLVNA